MDESNIGMKQKETLQKHEIDIPGTNNGKNCKNLLIFNANLTEKKSLSEFSLFPRKSVFGFFD